MTSCFHCDLPVPEHSNFELEIGDQTQRFCCVGCQAIASAIVEGGLTQFYRFRTENGSRPDDQSAAFDAYDLDEVQGEFVHSISETQRQAHLLLEGITCAACVWLIEKHLHAIDGVERVSVNASTHRCMIVWDTTAVALSHIMRALSDIGFHAVPATDDQQQALRVKESRKALMRLAVAGFGMMQVGMVAVGLYTGADLDWQNFLRWLSFIITTPVVFFSAQPFFVAAKRAIKTRHLSMDVPVSIAILGAYFSSVWATVYGGGEVYYDSVSMFTFLLLLGRYLEMRARHRNGSDSSRMAQLLPVTAQKWFDHEWRVVPLKALEAGDKVLVSSGTTIPCDGVVLEGCSGVVEAMLTGESETVQKTLGDSVVAGTINTDSALQIRAQAVGASTQLSAIENMVEQAQQDKPTQVAMADKLAGYFVGAVLIVSVLVAITWYFIDPSEAFWITLSVLVVTCPCALSLASPAALTAAISRLRKQGLLITRGHVLEGLPAVTRVIFDKTGTLTIGSPQIVAVLGRDMRPVDPDKKSHVLAIAAALETGSTHPIARAFEAFSGRYYANAVSQVTGSGVEGHVDGKRYKLGKPEFVLTCADTVNTPEGQWLALSCDGQPLAWIGLRDQLRESASPLVAALKARGIAMELLSGDGSGEVARMATLLGFDEVHSNVSPDEKLAHINMRQSQGEKVLMVGDGINDVPVLSGAYISVAMGGATDLAQTRADSVLLGSDLMALERAFVCAKLTRKVIKQNLTWALLYNLSVLPLAACGWVPPYAAAIGMSLSSLIVVGNALRIGKMKE